MMKIEIERQKRKNFALKIEKEEIKVLMPEYLDENNKYVKRFIQKGLAKIDKEVDFKFSEIVSKNELLKISNQWQEKLKVKPNRIQIKRMKNKWSSCSSKGNITFNSEIALLPKEVAEYVVIHELLHLAVPNHGKTFKVLLSAYLPNWEELHFKLFSYSILLGNIHY
ncbi:MAG: M48 family metallopeptidase [Candidatus Aerophobetes bacterium]|nr:M48 family metallopeptidase [Candidatus Aerophobetes bacterium]